MLRALTTAYAASGFSIRIDCALVPFLSADEELGQDAARLARFGIFGCEAAGALAAVTVDGLIAPCSFAKPSQLRAAHLNGGYAVDAELGRWRAYNDAPAEPCASCSLRPVCKGGCKIVAGFVTGSHGPDPECPRVLAHGKARAT
jgi:radical SAM protein with 4Fe4S-binding SPASM domain